MYVWSMSKEGTIVCYLPVASSRINKICILCSVPHYSLDCEGFQ